MSSIKIFMVLLVLCSNRQTAFAQGNTPRLLLLATAINSKGEIFVDRRPIPRIEFDEHAAWSNLEDSVRKRLGKAKLKELFNHCQIRDTAYWTDEELDKCILVHDRLDKVDLGYVIRKFQLTDEYQIRKFKQQISQFNATDAQDKVIYRFSRPVFDDSGKFAIIKWDSGHSWLAGGGRIDLYELIGQEWQYLGYIAMWKY